jgi:hypothetical protein
MSIFNFFRKVFPPKEKMLVKDKMLLVLDKGGKKCRKH